MNNIKIRDTKVRLKVNGDENMIISFDPDDVGFIERYYSLVDFLNKKQNNYITEAQNIDNSDETKEIKTRKGIKLLAKMCKDIKEQFGIVFGEDIINKIFGNSLNQKMFEDFLYGIAPYINKNRAEKLSKYMSDNEEIGIMK